MLLAKEPKRASDVLRYADAHYSQDEVMFAPGIYEYGSVLGKVGDEYVHWNPSGSDGSENVEGISLSFMSTAKSAKGVIVARYAIVVDKGLSFSESITPAERQVAIAALNKMGIICRNSI